MEDDKVKKFEILKNTTELFYNKINSLYCPYFKKDINFNSKGLDHIKMKSWNKTRPISDQYLRLKFLKIVPLIIGKSGTLQEINKTKNFERVKSSGRWQKTMKNVTYFAFIAIINDIKVKVIIKEVEGGELYFWSVIPFWKNKKNPIYQETKKVFHDGDLEND